MFHQSTRGVSLVELLIATFVVSVGVLGTVSALWYGIRSERYSDRRAQAVYQAREMTNLIRTRNLPFLDDNLDPGSDLNDGDYDNDGDDNAVWKDFNAAPFADDEARRAWPVRGRLGGAWVAKAELDSFSGMFLSSAEPRAANALSSR